MKFACRNELITAPIQEALRRRGWDVLPITDPREQLSTGEADIILGTPMEFARSVGVLDQSFLRGLGVFIGGTSGLITLVFKEHLQTVSSVALKEGIVSEAFAMQVLFSERHDIEPDLKVFPVDSDVDTMLSSSDCALMCGDDALFRSNGYKILFDVGDEWEDMTEMPLPYLIAWGRTDHVSDAILNDLRTLRDEALSRLPAIVESHPDTKAAQEFMEAIKRGDIRYELDDEHADILDTFFRYAFYYGVIEDIPSVKFLDAGLQNTN